MNKKIKENIKYFKQKNISYLFVAGCLGIAAAVVLIIINGGFYNRAVYFFGMPAGVIGVVLLMISMSFVVKESYLDNQVTETSNALRSDFMQLMKLKQAEFDIEKFPLNEYIFINGNDTYKKGKDNLYRSSVYSNTLILPLDTRLVVASRTYSLFKDKLMSEVKFDLPYSSIDKIYLERRDCDLDGIPVIYVANVLIIKTNDNEQYVFSAPDDAVMDNLASSLAKKLK